MGFVRAVQAPIVKTMLTAERTGSRKGKKERLRQRVRRSPDVKMATPPYVGTAIFKQNS